MAPRLCLALAWLAACALLGPATPVAESPEPSTAATDVAAEAGETGIEEPAAQSAPDEPAPPVASPPVPAGTGEEAPGDESAQPPAEPTPRPAADAPQPAVEPSAQPAPDGRDEEAPKAFRAAAGAVTIEDFSFGPGAVTVGVGETVTWRNAGPSEHTATATDGSFDTGLLASGESSSREFATAGTFSYICTPHPFMKGTVRVVAQAAGEAPQGGAQPAAEAAPSGEAAAAATGSELPRTGGNAGWLLITGIGLLLIGSAGRRRGRRAGI